MFEDSAGPCLRITSGSWIQLAKVDQWRQVRCFLRHFSYKIRKYKVWFRWNQVWPEECMSTGRLVHLNIVSSLESILGIAITVLGEDPGQSNCPFWCLWQIEPFLRRVFVSILGFTRDMLYIIYCILHIYILSHNLCRMENFQQTQSNNFFYEQKSLRFWAYLPG